MNECSKSNSKTLLIGEVFAKKREEVLRSLPTRALLLLMHFLAVEHLHRASHW